MVFVFLLVSILSISINTGAADLTLEEALEWGLKNNSELQGLRDDIEDIERQIEVIEAGRRWNFTLKGNPAYSKGITYQNIVNQIDPQIKEEGGLLQLSLEGSRSYSSGLKLNTSISLTEIEPYEFEDVEERLEYSLDLSHRLYPLIPDEREQEIYELKNSLEIARRNLEWEKSLKKIEWIDEYLTLLRLQERLELARLNFENARENKERVLKKELIGEAGDEEVLSAEIALKEAKLGLQQARNNFIQKREAWNIKLGLAAETEIELKGKDLIVSDLKKLVADLDLNLKDREKLMELVLENNPQIQASKMQYKQAERELSWEEKEGRLQVGAYASYEYSKKMEDDWTAGLNLSYDFMDGGQQKLMVEGARARLDTLKRNRELLERNLKLELDGLINSYRAALLGLETSKLGLERAELRKELVSRQYNNGMVTLNYYRQEEIKAREARVEYKAARDKLLIASLRLAQFLGLYE